VIPWVREWYRQYSGDDFVVVGVHTPEFAYEREVPNVMEALERLNVPYPVAIDNAELTWRAYKQRYWPTRYLIDKMGRIRYHHVGEGAYDQTAAAIEALMGEPEPAGR
jgi:hypothetical protein